MKPCAIAVAATKGGAGKTTLTACLAVCAATAGDPVALLDHEPQGSLTLWWRLRGAPDNPRLYGVAERLARQVATLKSQGRQWVFIDTPPGNIDFVDDAIAAADSVLIPVRASPIDMTAIEPVLQACRERRRPFAFVLTHYDPTWQISRTAAPALQDDGPVLMPPMQYRSAYVGVMGVGKTGPEAKDTRQRQAARDEIAAIWAAVRKQLKKDGVA